MERTPLDSIEIKRKGVLEKKGYGSVEQLTRFFPRHYYDARHPQKLSDSLEAFSYAVIGTLVRYEVDYSTYWVKAVIKDEISSKHLYITWIGAYYMYKELQAMGGGKRVLVYGKIVKLMDYGGHHYCTNPIIFTENINVNMRIHIKYQNVKGVAEKTLKNSIEKALVISKEEEGLPINIYSKYKLPPVKEALACIHHPENIKDIDAGQRRMRFNDMIYFALKLEQKNKEKENIRSVSVPVDRSKSKLILQRLPYCLTEDQQKTYEGIMEEIEAGNQVRALIQGDVGCGKTIVALLIAASVTDDKHQALLIAPTTVLAKQHFNEIQDLYPESKPVLLHSGMTTAEKRRSMAAIKNGETEIIVGTHSALTGKVQYNNLILAITDEEHRFGVLQRETVQSKSDTGCHAISMSATPIPRSLTNIMFANTSIYNIRTMPNGRVPVRTTIYSNLRGIFAFIEKEISKGHQAYVVCPLIDYKGEGSVVSVEETAAIYKNYFSTKNINVAAVTGKMKNEDAEQILGDYKDSKIHILISTTVIEVGVNNPNATVIIINNAERFGLATLHQLRGRVGRSSYESYCILNSIHKTNPRLAALCETNSGFEIAERDLELRGTGNIIGVEQSGQNKYIDLVLSNQTLYREIMEDAKRMLETEAARHFIEAYELAEPGL